MKSNSRSVLERHISGVTPGTCAYSKTVDYDWRSIRRPFKRHVTGGLARTLIASGAVALNLGCLDRPIGVSQPVTTNVVVERQVNNAITGIDLLLMIDNSSSMADKQSVLASAVPQLLGQLVQPQCVDANNNPIAGVTALLGANPPCTQGSPEFNPVNNIHIGIVTSSLGDHGYGTPTQAVCYPGAPSGVTDANGAVIAQGPDMDDMSHLMGTLTRGATAIANDHQTQHATVDTQGFLAWGDPTLPNPSNGDLTAATQIFTDMVTATAEAGCGFESQMEGWFRFLIDPVPPNLPIGNPDKNGQVYRVGSDDTLLAQRAAFLRPDSLVAIVMLTDENDCSVRDTDVGWVADDIAQFITTGSPACETNPNDPCCYSCTELTPPPKCAPCAQKPGVGVNDGAFQANIRMWQQKRRFGYEFLYPASRYVVGLTNPALCPDQSFGDMDCNCTYAKSIGASCDPGKRTLPNPLYSTVVGTANNGSQVLSASPNAIPRSDNSAIFLAGIIGVPWQDIGYQDANGNLVYIPVTDPAWIGAPASGGLAPITPAPNGIWANIYGDDNQVIFPQDIHMIESIVPRVAGQNVDGVTGSQNIIPDKAPWNAQSIPGPTAAANADPLNGHEWNTALEDLEYACIFPLPKPKQCPCAAGSDGYAACKYQHPNDCCDLSYTVDGTGAGPGGNYDKPLCDSTTTPPTQARAKGYPGLREIRVLHDYATQGTGPGNAIVASICPADMTSTPTDPGYGYNPAVAALINRLKEKLKGSCLPRQLTVDPNTGEVPCNIVEVVGGNALNGLDCNTYCQNNGRNVDLTTGQSSPVSPQMSAAVFDQMTQAGLCGGANAPACSAFCTCLLPQEDNTPNSTANGSDVATCQNADDSTVTLLPPGYCYVDPSQGVGNADLVAKCSDTQRRILRFAGNNPSGGGHAVPLAGAIVFTACQGSALANN